MKRAVMTLILISFTFMVTADPTSTLANTNISIDSADFQSILKTGVNIATAKDHNIVPFLPNEITSSLITILFGAVWRFFEKRKLEKRIREEKKNLE